MPHSSPPTARVHLLGRFAVEVAGEPVPATAWRKRRPVEVLAAVALAPGRSLHREELIDRLWPDKDLESGANNLHRALHDLRRVAGADLVTLDRGVARLAEGVWVDVETFEREVADGAADALARAVALYQGTLLPDDPYSDALSARREALRQRFVDVGLRLAALHEDGGDGEACIGVLRRVLAEDPTLEPAHQRLMRALALAGRQADALEQFAQCTRALRDRLDREPSRATLDLRGAIERGAVAPAPPVRAARPEPRTPVFHALVGARTAPLLGRAREVAQITQFVAEGRGVLLLAGEGGLGKTRLAGVAAELAEAAGAAVLVGRGLDLDASVPYAPFAEAWAAHRRAEGPRAATDPFLHFAPTAGSAQDDRLRLFQSVERALEELGDGGSVCLVIEDLHQIDPSSLHLFHHLARTTRATPLMLVGTMRTDEIRIGRPLHALLGSLGRERLGTRLAIEPLAPDANARLVAELLGAPEVAQDVAAAVYALTEGNPFHTEEVVQAMREQGTVEPAVPADLLDTVRHRVRGLGRDAERLFSAAAVVGQHFTFEVVLPVSTLTTEAALDALELGVEARIVEEDAGRYRFRHALTRQALRDGLTSARRVWLHRAVADAIEQQAGDRALDHAEALANHHEQAGQLDRAVPYLLASADRAQQRLGFAEAVAFCERALELADGAGIRDGAMRYGLLRRLGGMRLALSDLDGAVRDLDAAAVSTDPDWRATATQTAHVRRLAALALIQSGRLDEAGGRLDDAAAILKDRHDDPELPPVLYLFAQLRWHQERYAEARDLARRSLDEALARGDRRAAAKGHEMLALAYHALGDWQEGYAHEQARQEHAEGTLDVDQAFDVHLCLWEYHLYEDQDASGIRASVDRTHDLAQRMRAPRAVALCESFTGMLDFQRGQWDEAEASLRRAVDRFRLVGSASGEALSLQRLAVLRVARGDLDGSRALLDEGLDVGGRAAMRSHCLTRLHASLARLHLAGGDRSSAHASLEHALAEAARHGNCATCSALVLPEAVRVRLANEEVAEADGAATRLEGIAQRFGSRAWQAMALQARGRVLEAQGRPERAYDTFEQARTTFEEVGLPYEAARCVRAQSRVAPSAGQRRALATSAAAALSALGAADLEP